MQWESIKLIVVELTQSLKIFVDASREYNDWEVQPTFTIGFNNQNELIQNVEVEVLRTIGKQHAKIKAMTSFEIKLASKEYIPTTEQDFIEYASFQQVAIAHARALFLREARGTKYEKGLIPIDSFYLALQKIRLAVFNTGRLN
jgi:hypothetical protein